MPLFKAASLPTVMAVTTFETSGRFSSTLTGSATVTYNTNGLGQTVTASATDGSRIDWVVQVNNNETLLGNPTFSCSLNINALGTDINTFQGLGTLAATGGAINYTASHVGFKVLRAASGTASLYATQGNGTTETVSEALRTVVAGRDFDLIIKVNSNSVDYYTRQAGGALSAVTTLVGSMPTSTSGLTFQVSNVGVATASTMYTPFASWSR